MENSAQEPMLALSMTPACSRSSGGYCYDAGFALAAGFLAARAEPLRPDRPELWLGAEAEDEVAPPSASLPALPEASELELLPLPWLASVRLPASPSGAPGRSDAPLVFWEA